MKRNVHGWVVSPRASKRTGSISWQVDFGVVDGKRTKVSFPTKREAMEADLAGVVTRRSSLEKIDVEKARLSGLIAEQAGELEGLKREIARLRCVRAGVDRPSVLNDSVHLLELPSASSGVYFLCNELLDVLYVGMSTDVPARVARHRQRGKIVFSRVFFLPYPLAELFDRESEWIRKLRPPFNGEAPMRHACNHGGGL